MGLLPKPKYGAIETTRSIDDHTTMTKIEPYHEGKPQPTKVIIRVRHAVQSADASSVVAIMEKLFNDPQKLEPRVYTDQVKPGGSYYFLVEEYSVINLQ